jgi:hypothetical protein
MKEQMEILTSKLVNPYTNYKLWLRFEMLDIDAICEAVDTRNTLVQRRQDCQDNLKHLISECKDYREGKFKFAGIFKSTIEK